MDRSTARRLDRCRGPAADGRRTVPLAEMWSPAQWTRTPPTDSRSAGSPRRQIYASSRCLPSCATGAHVAIQCLECNLRAPGADTHARVLVGAINEAAISPFTGGLHDARQRLHVEVGEQTAVEGLHRKVGREAVEEQDVDVAVDRLER